MPKITAVEAQIPSIYRRSALNHLMYGYVLGVRSTLHTITIMDAINMFMDDFGLNEDSFNSNSAAVTFDRMQKELRQLEKSTNF